MNRIQNIEHEIKKLSNAELRAFRAWFLKHDSEIWDEQIENDVLSGKLDKLAQDSILAHKKGRSKQI
ncbi:MAG: hypothetical protein GYA70_10105 [Deltaproteobacteria bacterium]|jgi:hypothetical protein|nr:hypothetical protein [Deltaproteobacteria bacterium]